MSRVQNRSLRILLAYSWAGVVLPAGGTVVAQTIPPEVQAELDRLRAAAPAVTTFQARYRIENVTTVSGQRNSFVQEGRVYVNPTSVCILKDILPDIAEAQILYSRSDGTCLRYFPFSAYGQQVVRGSLDKRKMDFAKFWRPLLAHLSPRKELERMPSVALAGTVERDGTVFTTLHVHPDQSGEAEKRRHARQLERWGPPPDMTYFVSPATARIERVEAVHYREPAPNRSNMVVATRTSARLHNIGTFSGVSIPTTITFESRLPGHQAPRRRSTLTLTDIKVNQELPTGALEPIWPDDTIFLDVENQFADAYLPTSNEPASMINLADYYFGRGQRTEGLDWLTRFRDSIGSRTPTPSEAGNLARLYALAGRKAAGKKIHLDVIASLEQRVAADHDPADELLLTRYYTEYGYFLARARGRGYDAHAVAYLESRLEKLQSPQACARVCGRIAEHHTKADQYDAARNALNNAAPLIGDDTAAQRWIECCRKRVDVAQQRDEHWARIRAKMARIGELKRLVSQKRSQGASSEDTELATLEAELNRLQTQP
ncbi:MAG: hypothetical protein V3W34_19720 [Phycisphaerae bacterium]